MPEDNLSSPSRVVGYVDGYNVYYGLLTKEWKKFYWLDLQALFTTLLVPGDELVAVKYFTARGRGPQDSNRRQAIYLGALASSDRVEVIRGRFAKRTRRRCSYCGNYLRCLQCKRKRQAEPGENDRCRYRRKFGCGCVRGSIRQGLSYDRRQRPYPGGQVCGGQVGEAGGHYPAARTKIGSPE